MHRICRAPAPIEAYGLGGFRFAGMSHRGSLLCLPDGIWAWPITDKTELTLELLEPVFARADVLDFFLIGGGTRPLGAAGRLARALPRSGPVGRLRGDRGGGEHLQYPVGRKSPRCRRIDRGALIRKALWPRLPRRVMRRHGGAPPRL